MTQVMGSAERRAVMRRPSIWVAGIVLLSTAVRIALGRQVAAPWIMVDELIYSELAKSFASSGHFEIRGVASNGYGFVYPALIAPAWRLFGPIPNVYAAAKVINALLMSLAAIPAYLLARRLLSTGLALCAAVLAVAVPSMLYTSELMTENVFYPLFLFVCLALVAALERPTARRQFGVLVLCLLAFVARQQAIAFLPALALAPIALGVMTRTVRRQIRSWLPLWLAYAVAGCGLLAYTVGRGRSPLSILGAYQAATSVPYSTPSVLRFLLWHVAEIDLYLGVVPFAALLALWLMSRSLPPSLQLFVAMSLAVSLFFIVEVALFASTQSGRIEERNMFYVAPLALIALLVFFERGQLRRRLGWPLIVAAVVAAALPALIPLSRFVNTSALSDTFALLPLWWLQDRGISFDTVRLIVLAVSLCAAALFLFLPRRLLPVLMFVVAAYFVVTSAVVQNGRHGIRNAALGSLWAGIRVPHHDWIDREIHDRRLVAFVWAANPEPHPVYDNEFFNRDVGEIYSVGVDRWTGGLPEAQLHEGRNGALVDAAGREVRVRDAVTPTALGIAGKPLAQDPKIGLSLLEVNGPLIVLTKVSGLYADKWSAARVTYVRRRCSGGRLAVQLQSDPQLYATPQRVTAYVDGNAVTRVEVPPTAERRMIVPLRSAGNDLCTVVFRVATLRVPAKVEPGSRDRRPLGTRFLGFRYTTVF